jgi:hypothetical protein
MEVRFWIKSNRGTEKSIVKTLPNRDGYSETELEAYLKEELEDWCSKFVFSAWNHDDNHIRYGFEVLKDPQLKLDL